PRRGGRDVRGGSVAPRDRGGRGGRSRPVRRGGDGRRRALRGRRAAGRRPHDPRGEVLVIWQSGNLVNGNLEYGLPAALKARAVARGKLRLLNFQISRFPNQLSSCLAIVCSCRLEVPS